MTNRERIDSAMMKAYNNERADFVRSMNNIMVHMNDENAYMKWITVVPDGPDEQDSKAIPDDEDLFEGVGKIHEERHVCWKDLLLKSNLTRKERGWKPKGRNPLIILIRFIYIRLFKI